MAAGTAGEPASISAGAPGTSGSGSGYGQPEPEPEPGVWRGLLGMLRDPRVSSFFFLTFLMGLGYGCLGYLNLFLREQGEFEGGAGSVLFSSRLRLLQPLPAGAG